MYLAPERYEGATLDFSPFAESDVNTFANFFKICVGIYVFLSAYGLTCSYKKWNGGDSRFVAYRYFKMMMEFFFIYVLSIIVSLFVNSSWNVENVYGKGGMFAAAWKMPVAGARSTRSPAKPPMRPGMPVLGMAVPSWMTRPR